MLKRLFNIPNASDESDLKQKLMDISGVDQSYVNYVEVPIQDNEYVHVTIIDNYNIPDKQDLVLLHGLTGTAFCWVTMFKELSNYYRVYALDLPGQGLSSRIPYDFLNRDRAEDYFLERLKTTFDTLKVKNMCLIAHSFGGYLAGLLQIKYPEMIDQLILLSPLGLGSTLELTSNNAFQEITQSIAFKLKKGPDWGVKKLGILSWPIFSKYLERPKFRSLNDYEYDVFKRFLYCQVNKVYSSDLTIFSLFDKNLKAYKPLSLFHESFKPKKKVLILYGDEDWCIAENGEEFRKLIGEDIIEIDKIHSSHMMQTDNAVALTKRLFAFLGKGNGAPVNKTVETITNIEAPLIIN